MRRLIAALVAGTLFGAGLALGGMTDPARVRGFLDVFGQWDPTLAFVMAGAVAVTSLAWLARRPLDRPWLDERFNLPERRDLDPSLIGGAVLFGIGWGLAGLCPGPALANLALVPLAVAPFVAAMLGGMLLHRLFAVGGPGRG